MLAQGALLRVGWGEGLVEHEGLIELSLRHARGRLGRDLWLIRRAGADGADGNWAGSFCPAAGLGSGLGEDGEDFAELAAEFAELGGLGLVGGFGDAEGEGGFFVALLAFKELTGAGDGETLVVEERFDAEGHLDVAAAVEALAGSAFVGVELGKFTLPEA